MVDSKKNNQGFTLVEVMASMVILALLVLPLLSYFFNNIKINQKQREIQSATVMGQSVIEDIKSYKTIAQLVNATNGAAATDKRMLQIKSLADRTPIDETYNQQAAVEPPKQYYFKGKDLVMDGKEFEALITVNTEANTEFEAVNATPMPVISSLKNTESIIATENAETILAVNSFYNFNQRATSGGSGGSVTEAYIREHIKKDIQIDIHKKNEDYYQISIYNRYTLNTSVAGCADPVDSDMMFNEAFSADALKKIYLFYYLDRNGSATDDITESIQVNVDKAIKEEAIKNIKLIAMCQGINDITDPTHSTINDFNKDADNIDIYFRWYDFSHKIIGSEINRDSVDFYSNIRSRYNAGVLTAIADLGDVTTTELIQRIAEVKVTIYPKGSYDNSTRLVELTSTKGE